MRQPARARAFLAVFITAIVLGGWVHAQETAGAGTISEVSLPGGLAAARNAIGDPGPADRAHFLLEVIRGSYQTAVGGKAVRRDNYLRPLLDHLDRAAKGPDSPPAESETLPLPLTPAIWSNLLPAARGADRQLISHILRSPGASLLYCALLRLDDETRGWFASRPDLLADIVARSGGRFVLAAPGLRIKGGALIVPGGDAAAAGWQDLTGQSLSDPAAFVRALLGHAEGQLAYMLGATAEWTPAQIRFALNLDNADAGGRVSTLRQMAAVFARVTSGWDVEARPFWRPPLDPVMLAADLTADTGGRPRVPGTTAFWSAVFRDGALMNARPEDTGALTRDLPVQFSWLCDQIFTGGQAVQRGPYHLLLFASRNILSITPDNAGDALTTLRAVARYPALTGGLERARITDIRIHAGAARRAAALAAIEDDDRAARALAQFQGALALITRAGARGSLDDQTVARLITSLAALETERGDYAGKLVKWLAAAIAIGHPDAPVAGTTASAAIGAGEAGALDERALLLLSGHRPATPTVVEWEGTRYRLDFAATELARLRRLLGDPHRPSLSAAQVFAAAADAVASPSLTRAQLTTHSANVATLASAAGCDQMLEWETPASGDRCRELAAALARAARGGDLQSAARLASRLRGLADEFVARGLMELAYAAGLGQPDGAVVAAGDAGDRHDFGLDLPALARFNPWRRASAGVDRMRNWHVTGSLLDLDVTLAQYSLIRMTSRPAGRPTLNEEDRRVFFEAVPLVEPARLTDADHAAIVATIGRGRARLQSVRSAADADTIAAELRLAPWRRTVFAWTLAHDSPRIAAFLSPVELFLLGLDQPSIPASHHLWGMSADARTGCPCLRIPDRGQAETFAGRWHSGIFATGFADLNLRLAELLAELKMPASLLAPVLAAATWDFTTNVKARDFDDRRSLVDFVHSMEVDRVEQYLALLTSDGPLMPIVGGSGSGAPGASR